MDRILLTLIVAGVGGFIGVRLKIPAGALIGAMVSVALFGMMAGKGEIPNSVKLIAQTMVGGVIGLNFTMETFKGMKSLILPALILVVGLVLYSILLGWIIHKVSNLDLITALFCSAPGGLADMTIISEAYGANIQQVASLHLIRLVTIITMLPPIILYFLKTVGD